MLFRDVLKNSLISLLCFYLAITHGYALPTAENSSFLLTRDYGLSTWTDAGVEIDIYPEPNCAGDKFQIAGASLTYVMDYWLGGTNEPSNFRSFEISRALKDQEKLDLNKFGQGPDDTEAWSCGIFVARFMVGMDKGCYNIPGDESPTCLQLWQS